MKNMKYLCTEAYGTWLVEGREYDIIWSPIFKCYELIVGGYEYPLETCGEVFTLHIAAEIYKLEKVIVDEIPLSLH